jgi:hypothetical protein
MMPFLLKILRRLRIQYQNFDILFFLRTKIEKKTKILSMIAKIDFQTQNCVSCKIPS